MCIIDGETQYLNVTVMSMHTDGRLHSILHCKEARERMGMGSFRNR